MTSHSEPTETKPTLEELAQKKIDRAIKKREREKAVERANDAKLEQHIRDLRAKVETRVKAEATRLRMATKLMLGALAVEWIETHGGKRRLDHEAFKPLSPENSALLTQFIDGLKPIDAAAPTGNGAVH